MIRRRLMLGLLAGAAGGCSTGAEDADAPACPQAMHPPIASPRLAAAVARPGGPLLVALGSSSTAGAGATFPWRSYPIVLERRLRESLRVPVTVLNRGAGGEDADNMVGRLQRDVIAETPDLVVWQAGANAALRGMDPERFRRFVLEGLDRLRQAGIDVVLMDNQRAPRIAARPGHRAYDAILAEAAATTPGTALFSRGSLMDGLAAGGVGNADLLIGDGLHHSDKGYACVAEGLARALVAGLPPEIVRPLSQD